jgi:hypothetical protein
MKIDEWNPKMFAMLRVDFFKMAKMRKIRKTQKLS